MAGEIEKLLGSWRVDITTPEDKWTYMYEFTRDKRVHWYDYNSPENGLGFWNPSAVRVTLTWMNSKTTEMWPLPLTYKFSNAKLNASYFKGDYPVEKIKLPAAISLGAPPTVRQTGLKCWAAGAASWLTLKRGSSVSADQLVERFGGYLNPDGSLPEGEEGDDPDALKGGMRKVFDEMGIRLVPTPVAQFTYEHAVNLLKSKGQFVLVHKSSSMMGHTIVVYGVKDVETLNVMDPLKGITTLKIDSVDGTPNIYIGVQR